jgi:hypothetical protein
MQQPSHSPFVGPASHVCVCVCAATGLCGLCLHVDWASWRQSPAQHGTAHCTAVAKCSAAYLLYTQHTHVALGIRKGGTVACGVLSVGSLVQRVYASLCVLQPLSCWPRQSSWGCQINRHRTCELGVFQTGLDCVTVLEQCCWQCLFP